MNEVDEGHKPKKERGGRRRRQQQQQQEEEIAALFSLLSLSLSRLAAPCSTRAATLLALALFSAGEPGRELASERASEKGKRSRLS